MIQLANDPNASRMSWRPNAQGDKLSSTEEQARRRRTGHAWPFLSPHANRPERPTAGTPSNDSGS
ncbi:MAG: hypothetical protein ACXWC6_02385 [Ramlibacter sp.]